MAQASQLNWAAIDADPRFQRLHAKKTAFLMGLMIFSIIYYFLLPMLLETNVPAIVAGPVPLIIGAGAYRIGTPQPTASTMPSTSLGNTSGDTGVTNPSP